MSTDHRARLAKIKRFDQLIAYLRDEMGWPIDRIEIDDLTFEYAPEELGIDPKTSAKIESIQRLRPLSTHQPWGIFFLKFAPKKLPVVALRRILSHVVLQKRATARAAGHAAWAADDLLFISNYGEGEERHISFAHFSRAEAKQDLPTLKVLGWDDLDTALHLDAVASELTTHLAWPADEKDAEAWRKSWRAAFTLRHREVITTSKELSIRLAALARAIRNRAKAALAIETDRGPLTKLMNAFREALVHDLDADGFADMYAQTIAYGLLSARIADPHAKTADDFAVHMRTNPFLKELMAAFLQVGGRRGKAGGPGIDFDELGVSEVVELLDDANMEAVVGDFGDKNPQEDPVIHFYERFLKEYDPKKRMQRGVFYTPRPVVSYIVRSVDELLRSEFGLEDGLADTTTWGEMAKRHQDLKIPDGTSSGQAFVQILDPACGTGTFLVEVIDLVHKTLTLKWRAQGHGDKKIEALWNDYVPEHLLPRLHGYELLMAPYAIAHLKIGVKLYETGYRFGCDERARVFLTNALEPPSDVQFRITSLPALAHEAQAVNEIKRNQRFTVVIGNPPYSLLSANLAPHHRAMVEKYKFVNERRIVERSALQLEKNLNDDYVKFMALAESAVQNAQVGAIGFITNHSFLDNPTMRGLRWSLTSTNSRIWITDLHGNSTKLERSPDGGEDANVFQIRQGVAVTFLARLPGLADSSSLVRHHGQWGSRESKERWLASNRIGVQEWQVLTPGPDLYLFVPQSSSLRAEFEGWPNLTDVMPVNGAGYITARDELVIDIDRDAAIDRVERFKASRQADDRLLAAFQVSPKKGWDVRRARTDLRQVDVRESVIRTNYRPFDTRWIFFHGSLVWGRSWPTMRHVVGHPHNLTLLATRMTKDQWDIWVTDKVSSHKAMSAYDTNSVFPLYLVEESAAAQQHLPSGRRINLSGPFLKSLTAALGRADGDEGLPEGVQAEEVFCYVYATCFSPGYRARYLDLLKLNFPRVPCPGSTQLFDDLARLGRELVALHLIESHKLDRLITSYTGPKSPEVERVGWSGDTVWLDAAATKKGQVATAGTIGFGGVPEAVWNFHVGGYQVCEKWLKDRKGRTLSKDDIAHYQKIVVALNETIRLMKEIDEVIEKHGGWPGAFQTGIPATAAASVAAFRSHIVNPTPEERYVTCVPLVPLKAAAGAFGDPQAIADGEFEWVEVKDSHRLRRGMFVAQVVGKSMEPAISDGSYCLFAAPVEGSRQGKTVLVQLRDAQDPETGERYTVKRYESDKAEQGDLWRHATITLKPVNPEFASIVLTEAEEGRCQVIAELVEVLGAES